MRKDTSSLPLGSEVFFGAGVGSAGLVVAFLNAASAALRGSIGRYLFGGFDIGIAPRLVVTWHRNPYLTTRDLVGQDPLATLENEVTGDAPLEG
jgi:hypothetical protein